MRGVRVALLAVGVLVALAAPAAAHVELESAAPAADAVVTAAPATVRLAFTGPLAAGGDHAIGLFGPDGARLDDDTPVLVGDNAIEVGVRELRATGPHTVRYLVLAADGHSIEGEYAFAYEGPVTAPSPVTTLEATPSPDATASAAADPTPAPSPAADASPVAAQDDQAGGGGTTLAVVVVVAAVAGASFAVLRRRREH